LILQKQKNEKTEEEENIILLLLHRIENGLIMESLNEKLIKL
jgi:hypothetical protein